MKRDHHIGPGAASLILIIVILAMSVLSALALVNARSDERLTYRSANVIEATGELYAAAERELADVDAILLKARAQADSDEAYAEMIETMLPEGMSIEDRTISWTIDNGDDRKLICAIEILPIGSVQRFRRTEFRINSDFAEIELEDTWN